MIVNFLLFLGRLKIVQQHLQLQFVGLVKLLSLKEDCCVFNTLKQGLSPGIPGGFTDSRNRTVFKSW
jgi:hypothetical protein